MKTQGFTLIELLAAVAIVGVIATIALPRYRSMVARSRQAEATTNLGTISELQKAYYYDGERGYYHGGLHYGIDKCAKSASAAHNELGFRLADCTKSRYRYITNSGNDCAKSDGSIDQGQVYPGCGSNDVWEITLAGALSNPHDVVRQCPLGVSSASATCNPVSLPVPPPAPLSSPSSPKTTSSPPAPPAPPAPTCSDTSCWVLADMSCVKCGTVGGIKTTVPCSTCKIPTPYVYKPPPPPSVFCFKNCSSCSSWKTVSSGSWMPTASSKCSGSSFTQTRYRAKKRSCSSLCSGVACSTTAHASPASRSATGTKNCSTPPIVVGSPPSGSPPIVGVPYQPTCTCGGTYPRGSNNFTCHGCCSDAGCDTYVDDDPNDPNNLLRKIPGTCGDRGDYVRACL